MILAISIPLWDILTILGAVVLIVAAFGFWLLNLFSLPGNWMMLAAAIPYAAIVPHDHRLAIGWPVVAILVLLALVGEIVEFVAVAVGATKAGASRVGAVFALLGSIVGALAGLFVGIPVPVLGSILAALLFAGLGALSGAVVGELVVGRNLTESLNVGHAAFWGRLFGTLGKILVGAVMVVIVMSGTLLHGL